MKFSLILCTVNREKEVIDFLDSLVEQIYKNFEVIVVDQNYDNRVKNIIEKYTCLNIIYLKSDLGLSKARNIGLKRAIGDIVCFPDDDCTYPFVLLENVKNFFEKNVYHILMGKTVDFKTGKIVAGSNRLIEQELTKFYTLGSSTTLFIKNNHQIIFDERFGLGSIYASEEENELIFRLLKNGYKGYYGHTMGAAGVLESILSMTALDNGLILATRGFDELGVTHPVNISNQNRYTNKKTFIKLLSGFGGCNSAMLFRKG